MQILRCAFKDSTILQRFSTIFFCSSFFQVCTLTYIHTQYTTQDNKRREKMYKGYRVH